MNISFRLQRNIPPSYHSWQYFFIFFQGQRSGDVRTELLPDLKIPFYFISEHYLEIFRVNFPAGVQIASTWLPRFPADSRIRATFE
jgi:hypothetical protein